MPTSGHIVLPKQSDPKKTITKKQHCNPNPGYKVMQIQIKMTEKKITVLRFDNE